jgi:DNA-binding HxlR family transcriptional regulator
VGRIESEEQFRSQKLAIEIFNDRWSLLILCECFFRARRREDFLVSLNVEPCVLAERLDKLVAFGLLRRIRYQDFPGCREYALTRSGLDVCSAIRSAMPSSCDYRSASVFDGMATCADCGEVIATEMKAVQPRGFDRTAQSGRSRAQVNQASQIAEIQIDVEQAAY